MSEVQPLKVTNLRGPEILSPEKGQDRASRSMVGLLSPFCLIVIVGLTLLLISIALLSLQWRMVHDSPIMLYYALLVDQFHLVPYRDFLDMNLLGAYFLNLLLVRVFGYSDLGFRLSDLVILVGIILSTWFLLRNLGRKAAWWASVFFALQYFSYGPIMSMEREYQIILLISVALAVSLSFPKLNNIARGMIAGSLFGLAATIKPHAALAFLLVLIFQIVESIYEKRNPRHPISIVFASLFGFAVPILTMFGYIWASGGMAGFIDVETNYLPLYKQVSGALVVYPESERLGNLFLAYFVTGLEYSVPTVLAFLGGYAALFHSTLDSAGKRKVLLLVALAAYFALYPFIQGQFFHYHWLIYVYFISILSGLALVELRRNSTLAVRILPVVILAATLFVVRPPAEFWTQVRGEPLDPPKNGRVDAVADFLGANLRPGDTVQPLDWTGGALHAMLIVRARPATEFLGDASFYFAVSSEFTQNLRKRFLNSLETSRPRFIVEIETGKPWITGLDTTKEFPELRQVMGTDYGLAQKGDGYSIYERLSSSR